MTQAEKSEQMRLNRLQLVARVQIAYEQRREAVERARHGSLNALSSAAHATWRLSLLNRALALLAIGQRVARA
jgi:hypothetical protein